jgi:histidinol phosphatase-like enzyme (inositol monophosphatase family)
MHVTSSAAGHLQDLATFAAALASAVRPVSRPWFRHALEVHTKADSSPVTLADREVEAMLRGLIAERFPEHGILGEELGASHVDAEYVWSLDPIDGTRSFISGHPLWGTLIALLQGGVSVLGVIDMPVLDERWVGIAGEPTRFNGDVCRTSRRRELAEATLYTTSPDLFEGDESAAFERLSRSVRMRRFGGDCYSYALLAAGHVDLVLETGLQPYDYLALTPVIQGAGGLITDWSGRALDMRSDGRVLAAANAMLHAQALAFVAPHASRRG